MEDAWKAQDDDADRRADHALHAAIVDASQNATLIHTTASIYEVTKQGVFCNREFLKSIDGSSKTLLDQHLVLGRAVIEGDALTAETAAGRHIDFEEEAFWIGIERQRREVLAEERRMLSNQRLQCKSGRGEP